METGECGCFSMVVPVSVGSAASKLKSMLSGLAVADSRNLGVKELTILRTVRLLRLTRLGRIARLLRAVPEVVTLLKGIAAAIRSVFFTLLLLLVLLFVFGVVFKTQAKEDFPELHGLFPSVTLSVQRWEELRAGTGEAGIHFRWEIFDPDENLVKLPKGLAPYASPMQTAVPKQQSGAELPEADFISAGRALAFTGAGISKESPATALTNAMGRR
eukprot:Skav220368  [mRNA]  locus=scaffold609:151450:157723:+ [translate_table: standard]